MDSSLFFKKKNDNNSYVLFNIKKIIPAQDVLSYTEVKQFEASDIGLLVLAALKAGLVWWF